LLVTVKYNNTNKSTALQICVTGNYCTSFTPQFWLHS